jgi:hypothetical protein
MNSMVEQDLIGRVLRASTRGFSCGTHSSRIDFRHDFGAFVKVPVANDDRLWVIGLIYAVEIKDDLMVSELVMAEALNPMVLRDQRENRMVPVEISVLNVGYFDGSGFVHSLPPRPPMSLSEVMLCSRDEICAFTARPDYFRLVLSASEVPSDDLLATSLRVAASCWPLDQQRPFTIACGRHLARLLSNDLKRLAHILALIRPSD